MKKHLLIVSIMAASSTAFAGGLPGSVGVGVERSINNETGGLSLNYDQGKFHAGGFFNFHDSPGANNHYFSLGGRFFYHVHQTGMADFSLGVGIGIANRPDPTPMDAGNRATDMFLEPGFQIRMFLASNVALSFTAGIVIGLIDADGIAIDGQGAGSNDAGAPGTLIPNAVAGIHYYF